MADTTNDGEVVLQRIERDGQVYELVVFPHSLASAGVEVIESTPRVRITRAEGDPTHARPA